ncbi:MAG: ribbon-helix-helix protein, CopG family [Myxococcaceae bacterium]|nr:ribbon-helix-helix protein, CopG family [Myxococcaceae bacterium]MCI0672034.1 ribbon-helix-helix protein, CopG family [Myxococcaceae bacterium]
MEDMDGRRTTVILSPEEDRLLREASKREGISQSELIRRGIRTVTSGYVRRRKSRTGWLELTQREVREILSEDFRDLDARK